MKKGFCLLTCILTISVVMAKDHDNIVSTEISQDRFTLIENGVPTDIFISENEKKGVLIAAENLRADFERVCSTKAQLLTEAPKGNCIIVGTIDSPIMKTLAKNKKITSVDLANKIEKYIMTVVDNPLDGVNQALVIAGSDMRGTIYGIYELSEQIGVSPWYYWMDVPTVHQNNLSIARGTYTAGEPAVRYRGIFLNNEAPCLTTWVRNAFGTRYGGHEFYAKVFELILRLRGNYLWPAMWSWAFYADDPLNSPTAVDMGIIMGTSHHEPMARNHQEWARNRRQYGEWDYVTNQKVLDEFFREGIERAKDTEDIITIGMRGDGDTPMGGVVGRDHEYVHNDERTMKILEEIITNQRKIISKVTGRPAKERPQIWAVYKEVQRYYDKGMKIPDDVIILLSDDNWGHVRRVPTERDKDRKGGFGMYYHIDYVGQPRCSKWLNVTPIQHIWDQLSLTYQYGIDKLWVLNVGDLKPMEYPITIFMDMAWNPTKYNADNLLDHPRKFCAQQFGEDQADEAARLLNLYSQYVGRSTPEMLDAATYDLESGEWRQVTDEFVRLEAEALRQYMSLKEEYHDAYRELLLFPIQAMANIYEMYYAQAMNHKLYEDGNPEANLWADKVEAAFKRDSELCGAYNREIAGGKWNGMMIQKHISYVSWGEDYPRDVVPTVYRFENPEQMNGNYVFRPSAGYIAMDAQHYYSYENSGEAQWTAIPFMGRTRGAMAVQPYTTNPEGTSISYRMNIPEGHEYVDVHIITASTLAFKRYEGHRYTIGFEGQDAIEVNFNGELNEEPENIERIMYPTVARRVVKKTVRLKAGPSGMKTLTLKPLDPSVLLEKIVIDLGGYKDTFLFMEESPCTR